MFSRGVEAVYVTTDKKQFEYHHTLINGLAVTTQSTHENPLITTGLDIISLGRLVAEVGGGGVKLACLVVRGFGARKYKAVFVHDV
jgi:hypothetical protein